jgi:hypothetical protein
MSALVERRIRAGHFEWRCPTDGSWYSRLASHLHRFHHRGGHVHGCHYCRPCNASYMRPGVVVVYAQCTR